MTDTMVKRIMLSLPVLLAKQELPAFSRLNWIDLCSFLMQGVSRDYEQHG